MKSDLIREGERLDDLGRNSLQIIQKKDGYSFAMDSVLLADFAFVGLQQLALPGQQVLDLCTGSGVVMLLMEARYPGACYTGVELQESLWDRAQRSVLYNEISDQVHVLRGDIRRLEGLVAAGSMDAVTANPPYMKAGSGKVNPNPEKAIARHELECSLSDVVAAAAYALKDGGRFYMVHLAERKTEILKELSVAGLCPVRLREVVPHEGEKANLLLVECVKGTDLKLRIENPLIVYRADQTYTDEIMEIYGHGR